MTDTTRGILSKSGVLQHFHNGTRPEESGAVIRGEVVENKGYNPPPPVVEKVPAAADVPETGTAPASAEDGESAEAEGAAADDNGPASSDTEEA